jgi:hypothetical protein
MTIDTKLAGEGKRPDGARVRSPIRKSGCRLLRCDQAAQIVSLRRVMLAQNASAYLRFALSRLGWVYDLPDKGIQRRSKCTRIIRSTGRTHDQAMPVFAKTAEWPRANPRPSA